MWSNRREYKRQRMSLDFLRNFVQVSLWLLLGNNKLLLIHFSLILISLKNNSSFAKMMKMLILKQQKLKDTCVQFATWNVNLRKLLSCLTVDMHFVTHASEVTLNQRLEKESNACGHLVCLQHVATSSLKVLSKSYFPLSHLQSTESISRIPLLT